VLEFGQVQWWVVAAQRTRAPAVSCAACMDSQGRRHSPGGTAGSHLGWGPEFPVNARFSFPAAVLDRGANHPDHDRLYGRRNDTESGNRLLDDSMLRERAHTVGHHRQLLNLTTWAALRNASAARQHARPDTSDPPAIAA
jgi:hypothetical protein